MRGLNGMIVSEKGKGKKKKETVRNEVEDTAIAGIKSER